MEKYNEFTNNILKMNDKQKLTFIALVIGFAQYKKVRKEIFKLAKGILKR